MADIQIFEGENHGAIMDGYYAATQILDLDILDEHNSKRFSEKKSF